MQGTCGPGARHRALGSHKNYTLIRFCFEICSLIVSIIVFIVDIFLVSSIFFSGSCLVHRVLYVLDFSLFSIFFPLMTVSFPVTNVKWHQTRDQLFLSFVHSDPDITWSAPKVEVLDEGRSLHVKDKETDT